jgi:hypothetical protein
MMVRECTSTHYVLFWIVVVCDRTTLEMRGLSPSTILADSRQSENAQTHTYKHTVSHMNFKLKLLQIRCHVLRFTKTKPKMCFER